MTAINNLGKASAVTDADLIPLYSASGGQTLAVAASTLAAYMAGKMSLPQGLLSAMGAYSMGSAGIAPNIGTVFQDIAPQADPKQLFNLPAAAASLNVNSITGEFIAMRNILAALVLVNATFTLANPRVLTLGLITGPDANVFTLPTQSVVVGSGAPQAAHFAALVTNPNNANRQINQGDKIRLVAKTDQAATLVTFATLSMQVFTLDGV